MNHLEKAMATLMHTFDTYSVAQGKKDTITNAEMKDLLQKEFPTLLQGGKNPGEVDKLMKDLDCNEDSDYDFSEFMVLVTAITCAFQDRSHRK